MHGFRVHHNCEIDTARFEEGKRRSHRQRLRERTKPPVMRGYGTPGQIKTATSTYVTSGIGVMRAAEIGSPSATRVCRLLTAGNLRSRQNAQMSIATFRPAFSRQFLSKPSLPVKSESSRLLNSEDKFVQGVLLSGQICEVLI